MLNFMTILSIHCTELYWSTSHPKIIVLYRAILIWFIPKNNTSAKPFIRMVITNKFARKETMYECMTQWQKLKCNLPQSLVLSFLNSWWISGHFPSTEMNGLSKLLWCLQMTNPTNSQMAHVSLEGSVHQPCQPCGSSAGRKRWLWPSLPWMSGMSGFTQFQLSE